jgi:ribosomal protein S18 acetylase RimI-like enzyme
MNPTPDCRLLTLAEVDSAARVISQAFVDDPLCRFMLPFRRTRTRTLYKFFRAYGEITIKHQRGFGAGEPLQGVAFWEFPDQQNISVSLKALGKFLPLLFTMYPIGFVRARGILEQTEMMHKKYAAEPHFYLDNIGVLASARGKGLSSKLIRPFLAMADEQKVMAYTDTVTPANVPLYEHFGFQVAERGTIGRVTVWALRRPVPASQSALG